LGEHGQVLVLQIVENRPGGLHDVGVGHHHARRQAVGAKNGHRHPGLDGQRFIVFEIHERVHNGMIAFPVAGALADAAVDDQPFGGLGILHVVLEHTQQPLLLPPFAAQQGSALGPDRVENF